MRAAVRRRAFAEFINTARERLDAGEAEYGDSSFRASIGAQIDMAREELSDLVNYAFMMDCRLIDLRRRLEPLEETIHDDQAPPAPS